MIIPQNDFRHYWISDVKKLYSFLFIAMANFFKIMNHFQELTGAAK